MLLNCEPCTPVHLHLHGQLIPCLLQVIVEPWTKHPFMYKLHHTWVFCSLGNWLEASPQVQRRRSNWRWHVFGTWQLGWVRGSRCNLTAHYPPDLSKGDGTERSHPLLSLNVWKGSGGRCDLTVRCPHPFPKEKEQGAAGSKITHPTAISKCFFKH